MFIITIFTQLLAHIAMYSKRNISVDESTVFRLMATIANDYATLLLYERTQDLFSRIVAYYPPHSEDYYNRSIGVRATHILAVLSFAEGNLAQVLYAYAFMYVCMHVCMYVCMYVCIHLCLSICMYVFVCKKGFFFICYLYLFMYSTYNRFKHL